MIFALIRLLSSLLYSGLFFLLGYFFIFKRNFLITLKASCLIFIIILIFELILPTIYVLYLR